MDLNYSHKNTTIGLYSLCFRKQNIANSVAFSFYSFYNKILNICWVNLGVYDKQQLLSF